MLEQRNGGRWSKCLVIGCNIHQRHMRLEACIKHASIPCVGTVEQSSMERRKLLLVDILSGNNQSENGQESGVFLSE